CQLQRSLGRSGHEARHLITAAAAPIPDSSGAAAINIEREGGYLPDRRATMLTPGADPMAAPIVARSIAALLAQPRFSATRTAPKVEPRIAPPNHPAAMPSFTYRKQGPNREPCSSP